MTNVIGNAIKFTEQGTIVVRTTVASCDDDICTMRFEVVDTGVGIPSHLHEHVFEGFSQADTSTTRQFGGTGLGLTISKRLVELRGGEIGVISRPGVGSNFWFTIRGELCRAVTATDRDLSGVRALIVSATGVGRDILRHQLGTCGATSFTVPSAERALAILQGQGADAFGSFDVALIDTQSLDGLALAGQLRTNGATKSLPLILVSTVNRPKQELQDAGIDGTLSKPVQRDELFASVAKVTGRLDLAVPTDDEVVVGPIAGDKFAGARVLVAEDNAVNRKVATTMLQSLGCYVDVAFDGTEAVEAVLRERYDLVFLDCQMPNMDGYETARQIRRLEKQSQLGTDEVVKHVGHLPLSALTAHAAAEDRERSLESGMDDYVSKPINLRLLRDVIAKWVGTQAGEANMVASESSTRDTDAPNHSLENAPVNEDALRDILELDRASGGGIFAGLIRIFLDEAPPILADLRNGLRDESTSRVARAAHSLKSSSLSVGAPPWPRCARNSRPSARKGPRKERRSS